MAKGFLGETVALGVYEPVYNPSNPTEGLEAYGVTPVGHNVEFPSLNQDLILTNPSLPVTPAAIDITSNKIDLILGTTAEGHTVPAFPFDGYVFSFQGHNRIAGVKILDTNIPGLDGSHVHFNNHQIFANGSGLTFPSGEQPFVELGVRFAPHHS